jgi:hypothetical protein
MSSFSVGYGVRPVRRISIWIAASIALNLLMGGWILSWTLGLHPAPKSYDWQIDLRKSLSPADGVVIEKAVQQFQDARLQGDRNIAAHYDRLFDILSKEPFDADAANLVLTEMNTARTADKATAQPFFLEELRDLSPAGRALLLASMQKRQISWRASLH